MAKKIYDIKPPKVAHKVEKEVRDFLEKPKIRRARKSHQNTPAVHKVTTTEPIVDAVSVARNENKKFEEKLIFVKIIGVVVVLLLFAGVYLFFKLPKAEILIWPKVETLTLTQKILADKSTNNIDEQNLIIPAKYFEVTKTKSQEFPATGSGNNEGKASGKITVFNKYEPFRLFAFKAGTRFVSDSGKLFLASEKVVIPAAKKLDGKIVPGSVEISVTAAEGGADYNIAPSHFSVPGLKGTAFFFSVYAVSDSAMAGGYSGSVKKITEDDLQSAKNSLRDSVTQDAISAVKAQISSDYVLLDNAIISSIADASSKNKAGDIAEKFNYFLSVKASALAFRKSDVDQLIKKFVNSQIPEGKTILDNATKIDYSSSVIDISSGKAKLNLAIQASYYKSIDSNFLSLFLLNQNEKQIKDKINSVLDGEVSKTEVNFWPFWVKSSPNSQKAVNLRINLE